MIEHNYENEVNELKAHISSLEAQLKLLYEQRRKLFIAMDTTMTRREIGEIWGISNVAVTKVINRNKYKVNW